MTGFGAWLRNLGAKFHAGMRRFMMGRYGTDKLHLGKPFPQMRQGGDGHGVAGQYKGPGIEAGEHQLHRLGCRRHHLSRSLFSIGKVFRVSKIEAGGTGTGFLQIAHVGQATSTRIKKGKIQAHGKSWLQGKKAVKGSPGHLLLLLSLGAGSGKLCPDRKIITEISPLLVRYSLVDGFVTIVMGAWLVKTAVATAMKISSATEAGAGPENLQSGFYRFLAFPTHEFIITHLTNPMQCPTL